MLSAGDIKRLGNELVGHNITSGIGKSVLDACESMAMEH